MAVVAAVVALSARLPDPATVPDGPLLHFRESYALLDGKRNGNPQVYKPNIYESWSRQWPESPSAQLVPRLVAGWLTLRHPQAHGLSLPEARWPRGIRKGLHSLNNYVLI